MIDIHFNVSFLYEDHGICFLQTYVEKMAISAKFKGLWLENCAICCLANYCIGPPLGSICDQKQIVYYVSKKVMIS
jgi:hypothetical protein